jgi:hypothetical protein
MRANSSCSSLVVVVLALVGGCSPAQDPPVVVALPEPPVPAPSPAPAPSQATLAELLHEVRNVQPVSNAGPAQGVLNEVRESTRVSSQTGPRATDDFVPPTPPRRLFFQCDDNVTFAVQTAGSRLEVFPPGHSTGYIALVQVPSDSGVHYTAANADFRMSGDLATLQVGRDRYVDCVSNPAAAVWQEPPRRGIR